MPMFVFKCDKCEAFIEKFLHNFDDEFEFECNECGGTSCSRELPIHNTRIRLDARDMLNEKILPDARRIMKDINEDKKDAFADICGDE